MATKINSEGDCIFELTFFKSVFSTVNCKYTKLLHFSTVNLKNTTVRVGLLKSPVTKAFFSVDSKTLKIACGLTGHGCVWLLYRCVL